MSAVEVYDDNESVTLRVTTTVGESGLDVSTDGSAESDTPVRIEVTVSRTLDGDDRTYRTDYDILVMGTTLADAVADRSAKWMCCPDLVQKHRGGSRSTLAEQALDRMVPGWENGLFDAEIQIQREADAPTDDSDETWMALLDERPSEIAWYSIPGAEVQS